MAIFNSVDWKSNSRFSHNKPYRLRCIWSVSSGPWWRTADFSLSVHLFLFWNSCRSVTSSLTHTRLLQGNSCVLRLSFSLCLLFLAVFLHTLLCPSCYVTNSWSYRNPVCWRWFSLREAFIVSLGSHTLLGDRAVMLLCSCLKRCGPDMRKGNLLTLSCHMIPHVARRVFNP